MANTLIVKIGALGDVVRVTPLLRVLNGPVYWLTDEKAASILPVSGCRLVKVITRRNAERVLKTVRFGRVLSLDEDRDAVAFATMARSQELIGACLDKSGAITYTESSRPWFDMGLVSRLGKARADALKKKNTRTYQDFLFAMAGLRFDGQEYLLNLPCRGRTAPKSQTKLVGIEARAGVRWPMKVWNKYNELAARLRKEGVRVVFFRQRRSIREYARDIGSCDVVVTGDSLALHLALALRIPTVGLFICTSPNEIFGYGRLTKVISPCWKNVFYSTGYIPEAVDALAIDDVFAAVTRAMHGGMQRV